jgi:hypothetical protein
MTPLGPTIPYVARPAIPIARLIYGVSLLLPQRPTSSFTLSLHRMSRARQRQPLPSRSTIRKSSTFPSFLAASRACSGSQSTFAAHRLAPTAYKQHCHRYHPIDQSIFYTVINTIPDRKASGRAAQRQAYIARWDAKKWKVEAIRKVGDKGITTLDVRYAHRRAQVSSARAADVRPRAATTVGGSHLARRTAPSGSLTRSRLPCVLFRHLQFYAAGL